MEINDDTGDLESPLSAAFPDATADALHSCKILVIDDEETNVILLERVLIRAGFDNFISTSHPREAASLFSEFQPDLVLTDWLMPEVDGCTLIESLRALTATDDYLPIVVLTADMTPETRKRALATGATDFLTKPFDQIEVVLRIHNLLQARLSHLTNQRQNAHLEESVRQRTIDLERALAELRRTQTQIIQHERLAALGTMAGGIAHDFNNALSIIMGFGELLLRDCEHGLSKEEALMPITTILTAAGDAAKIVRRLGGFYRVGEPDEQRLPVNLIELIDQAVSLTQPRWQTEATANGREIRVLTHAPQIPWIKGDAAELREVLTNLIFNAVDALPAGGTITIDARIEKEMVVLKVSDSGIGMTEEVRQHCLEPFFTTKGEQGTGLGLAMVFGIVERHDGTVEIESESGKGTTFILRLPAVAAPEMAVAAPSYAPSGPLRILVVDDQPILCQLVCEYLEEDLHCVEMASSGFDALEKFRATDFDIVITDHVMTGMTGEQLAITLKASHPHVPIMLLTGYASDVTTRGDYAGALDLVLAKPITRAALRQAIQQLREIGSHREPLAALCEAR